MGISVRAGVGGFEVDGCLDATSGRDRTGLDGEGGSGLSAAAAGGDAGGEGGGLEVDGIFNSAGDGGRTGGDGG